MAKNKEEKTNVMRVLEQKKIAYTAHTYPHEEGMAVDGVTVAKSMGFDPAIVFKTLVARGAAPSPPRRSSRRAARQRRSNTRCARCCDRAMKRAAFRASSSWTVALPTSRAAWRSSCAAANTRSTSAKGKN